MRKVVNCRSDYLFNYKKRIHKVKATKKVKETLTDEKYKIALQKQNQTEIWISLCKTFSELYDGDIRKLFDSLDNDVDKIRNFIQKENKKKFPYLSGTKICNYWLYVIYQYTDRKYKNIEHFKETKYKPIDIHTPLWLWSRNGFKEVK